MNIQQAKQQIKNTIEIYLQKDELGTYKIPVVHQRPVFLLGAPGLGKTAIMQQIAKEMNIGLVSYSMTHHTRQSAIGLPVIVEKSYENKTYQVSEYTMSEIIDSIYSCMRETGHKEGILFLDEINCVSETLAPSMLLFLQYKVFGGNQVPEGWVVVTAGNPPRFNKSVKEFDSATKDRLKVIEIEPEYAAWKKYAVDKHIDRCILSYLDLRQEDFYKVETTVTGLTVVTPRAWEDLSKMIQAYKSLGLKVDEELMVQYIQNKTVCHDFAIYYDLYQKYHEIYDIQGILAGKGLESADKLKKINIEERITLISLLLEELFNHMSATILAHDALFELKNEMKKNAEKFRASMNFSNDIKELSFTIKQEHAADENHDVAIELIRMINSYEGTVGLNTLDCLKQGYMASVADLKKSVASVQEEIKNLLEFVETVYGTGLELSLVVNDLTDSKEANSFIGQFLSLDYFKSSQRLYLHAQEKDLLQAIDLSGLI